MKKILYPSFYVELNLFKDFLINITDARQLVYQASDNIKTILNSIMLFVLKRLTY